MAFSYCWSRAEKRDGAGVLEDERKRLDVGPFARAGRTELLWSFDLPSGGGQAGGNEWWFPKLVEAGHSHAPMRHRAAGIVCSDLPERGTGLGICKGMKESHSAIKACLDPGAQEIGKDTRPSFRGCRMAVHLL